jgi:molybdopterin-guanine dinucleotide biosynthesis protein A
MRVSGLLLVGGASRRFGSPKALARVGGTTLADLAWARLAWCDERLAFGKAADRLPLPFPVHDDGSDVRAPIAGLVAGLRAARHDVVVALPVDVPLITEAALRELAAACDGDAAVPETGPLPGAYRRGALTVLERRLHAAELELAAALDELHTRIVAVDPALLANVNRREDMARLRAPAVRTP